MIPKSYLNNLEREKEKTYDETNKNFLDWLLDIANANYGDSEFLSVWTSISENNEMDMGWNSDTLYANFVTETSSYPLASGVKAHYENMLKSKLESVTDISVSDYITISNIGEIQYSELESLRDEYSQKLAKTYIPIEKAKIQNIVDTLTDNIIICRELSKECKEYWDNYYIYRRTWNTDVKEYKQQWQTIINGKKNSEPEDSLDSSTNTSNTTSSATNSDYVPLVLLAALNSETPSSTTSYLYPAVTNPPETNNVFSMPNENTYLNINTSTNTNQNEATKVHTRIYKYFDSSIQLDEMSIPVFDDIDTPFRTVDTSSNAEKYTILNGDGGGYSVSIKGSNDSNVDPFQTAGNTSPRKSMAIGFLYPLIRINDHYYIDSDIKYFSLESTGWIPTIELVLDCKFNDILKVNAIKDGDICSVFINPGHGTVRSYRGDFLITHVKIPKIDQFKVGHSIKVKILGELYIPRLYDTDLDIKLAGWWKRVFSNGTSARDAIINMAKALDLGFFFSDPENTTGKLHWNKYNEDDLKNGGDPPNLKYLKYVAAHAYKNFESFYDCWIDPRYGVSFINIALMLGGSGLDEDIDLAVFNSALVAGKLGDAENKEVTDAEKSENPKPLLKLLTNFGTEESTETAFLVISYGENNDSTITNELGFTNKNYYSLLNPGITNVSDGKITESYCIPVNEDKLKNGFYVMAGPGLNLTYTQADNGSFVKLHNSKGGGLMNPVMSDSDEQAIEEGNNDITSGNVNKYYKTAEGHNELCNKWLLKKTISVILNGCNLQLMRGEKIPMLLKDNFNPQINFMQANNNDDFAYQQIIPQGSGWFIIHDIKWVYDNRRNHHSTPWRTELTLTRREWPIPGYNKRKAKQNAQENKNDESVVIDNNPATGTVKEADQDANPQNTTTLQLPETIDVTTNGLQPYMTTIYNDIKEACTKAGVNMKLISGRRWPVDENGNKVSIPMVQEGNMWKFVNSNGDTVWYNSKTSPHITGDAIDIINGEGSSSLDVMACILNDNKTLYDMLINSTYFGNETMDNNSNAITHFHIGKVDKNNQSTQNALYQWWEIVSILHGAITYENKIIAPTEFQKYLNA